MGFASAALASGVAQARPRAHVWVVAMDERSHVLGARSLRRAIGVFTGAGALLFVASMQAGAAAQTPPPALQRYFANGADMLTVPKAGEPGSAWFSNGAEATAVPSAGQPGSAYFSSGADATTTRDNPYYSRGAEVTSAQPGTPSAEYFSHGAEATTAQPGTVAGQYFSRGAELTTVPKPGQPGAAYYHQGADGLSMSRWFDVPTTQTAAASEERVAAPAERPAAPAEPSEPPSAPEVEEAVSPEDASQDAGAPVETQAARLTPEQSVSPSSADRAIESPQIPSAQTSQPAASPRQPDHTDAATPLTRSVLGMLKAYTLASLLPIVAALLLAMLVVIGIWASLRRHG